MLEARRLAGALIVHGHASRDHYDVGIFEGEVRISGTLWDRRGPAVSFGDDALRFHTKVSVDCGVLADGYDGTWTRNHE